MQTLNAQHSFTLTPCSSHHAQGFGLFLTNYYSDLIIICYASVLHQIMLLGINLYLGRSQLQGGQNVCS